MRNWILASLAVAIVAAVPAFSQASPEKRVTSQPPLTRVIYKNTQIYSFADAGFPQVCFAFGKDGHYLLWRSTTSGTTDTFGGTLSQQDLKSVRNLLSEAEIGVGGGIVRGDTKALMIEVPKQQEVERKSWVSDRDTPFPGAVIKLENWLQHFKPANAKHLDLDKRDICPAPRDWPADNAFALSR